MVFDRGLPAANLNNAAGASRSNVAWAYAQPYTYQGVDYNYAIGDDFKLGSAGQTYVISTLRVWIVGTGTSPLSDLWSSLTLIGGGTTPASLNKLYTVSTTGDPNVAISHVQYTDPVEKDYQGSSGSYINIWQVDFLHLNWAVQGGDLYTFFVDGARAGTNPYSPFLHASNAALSGSPQQGADNLIWALGRYAADNTVADMGTFDSLGNGWDKSSDVNVEIFTPEPSSALLFGTGLAIAVFGARRRLRGW